MLYTLLTAIAASVLSISPKPATRPGETSAVSTPPPEIVAANDAVQGFAKALRDSDWARALGYCSPPVQEAAGKYPSPEAFFREVVPVKSVIENTRNPIYFRAKGWAKGGEWQIDSVTCIVAGLEPDPADKWGLLTSREVWWQGWLKQVDSRWVVDLPTTPLREHIDKRLTELRRIRREAIANETALEPKLSKVHTRLIPLARRYQAGAPMLFRLELVNEGPARLVYDKGSAGSNQSMAVKDAKGQTVQHTGGQAQTAVGHEIISPGQTVVVLDKWDLGIECKLTVPGTYTVQFRGGIAIAETHPHKTIRVHRAGPANNVEILPDVGRRSLRLFPSNIVQFEVVTNETANAPRE